jgi:pseudouridine kinase
MNKILIIGAQNTDIFSKTNNDLIIGDSNPSKINISFGGVGRNIAVNLSRLGHNIHFLSVFGDDLFSQNARQNLKEIGINIEQSLFLKNQNNSIFLGVLNKDNNLHLGLSDMGIIEHLNPEFFKSKKDYIEGFDMLVIDNNLCTKAIEYLLQQYESKTIIMDAVSAQKAPKLLPYLHQISLLKVNLLELHELSKASSIEEQLNDLHDRGAQSIILTQQDKEVILSRKENSISQTPQKTDSIINSSGAGDAFLSGFIHGMINTFSDKQKLKLANSAARITLNSDDSTSIELNINEINKSII